MSMLDLMNWIDWLSRLECMHKLDWMTYLDETYLEEQVQMHAQDRLDRLDDLH
jgi:hypothetical protein